MNAKDVNKLLEIELLKISNKKLRNDISSIIVFPYEIMKKWEYGHDSEIYQCWIVAIIPNSNFAIAYSKYGHGKIDPWGIVNLNNDWFGSDDYWFSSLEDAFLEFFPEASSV